MVNDSGRGSGVLGIYLFVCVPHALCSLRSFFYEAASRSIDLTGYLAVNLLGENGDDTIALEALHS